jgi:hypothetical protein
VLKVREVLEETSEIKFVFLGIHPEAPVDELEELCLEQVHLLKMHAADVRHEVIAIEDVIVKLGCEEGGGQDKPKENV